MTEAQSAPNRTLQRNQERHPSSKLLKKALSSPLRRKILRILHRAGEARSPSELSRELGKRLSHTIYHVNVLKECEVIALTGTREKRGATEHFYASSVPRDSIVRDILNGIGLDDIGLIE